MKDILTKELEMFDEEFEYFEGILRKRLHGKNEGCYGGNATRRDLKSFLSASHSRLISEIIKIVEEMIAPENTQIFTENMKLIPMEEIKISNSTLRNIISKLKDLTKEK